jgi:hypothetical protein
MPNDRLKDLLQSCTVEVTQEGRVSTGFWFGRQAILADLFRFWEGKEHLSRFDPEFDPEVDEPDPELTVRTRENKLVNISGVGPIRVWDQDEDDHPADDNPCVQMVVVHHYGEHPSVDVDMADPEDGDSLLIATPSRVIQAEALGLGRHDVPYDLTLLGVSAEQLSPEIAGAPVMISRTARVWAMVVYGWPGAAADYCLLPFRELKTDLFPYLPEPMRPTNADWWAEQLRLDQVAADSPNLLFRLYIPSQRLYAAEAIRLLSTFREWLTSVRGYSIRREGYTTASGEMIEFFAEDDDVARTDWPTQLDAFAAFLSKCGEDRDAAVRVLVDAGLRSVDSFEFVERIRREMRRIEVAMRSERGRRILALQQGILEQLLDAGIDLPFEELVVWVESLVPGPSAVTPLALLAGSPIGAQPQLVLNNPQFNQQIIQSARGAVINNVAGNLNLGPKALELLALAERFGAERTATLKSAVYEFEDSGAPKAKRLAARERLKSFLSQVAGIAKDVGTELLTKYLESKAGL